MNGKHSVSKRLRNAFFWVALFVAVSGAVGLVAIEMISDGTDIIFEKKYPIVQAAYSLSISANSELLALHSYLLKEKDALLLMEQWNKQSAQHLNSLKTQVTDSSEQQAVTRIDTMHERIEQLTGKMVELSSANTAQDQTDLVMQEMEHQIDSMLTEINNLIQMATDEMDQAMNQADAFQKQSRVALIAVTILAFLISFQLGRSISSGIIRPLEALVDFSNNVARGDLRREFHMEVPEDEIGALVTAFRIMISNLRKNLQEVTDGSTVIASSVAELSASSAQLASSAAENATSINETTTTVEEVRQTTELSNTKAEQMANESVQIREASRQGRKSTDETIEGMNKIDSQMSTIAETIIRLSEQSQAIGQIIATVDSLSEQSNVLAVNASIEAAKAGEHGKGFSVVAQEVKNLAEQSKQATNEVRGILNEIQKATSSAVMATEQGSKVVEKGTSTAAQTGQAIITLTEGLEHSADAATQIAAASQQQRVGMDQITAAMESVRETSQQNATSARQLEGAVQNLKTLGDKLQEIITGYRL
ncbi:methyl-accepting chemotaxis protein [Tichowtungia aerotolerans]|uniref:HAMP domain-containing protein n=1 Tax=Tichowtungia aerotolerans TaxID=2697043 RepID=A0A6P1M775_9BACT|nr:methyl-accepting chemotaxis protein [Tichowtungia aerotolerans]QHI69701.1 HAMP domain-containing protein [Tichowtungia aerotolerans]